MLFNFKVVIDCCMGFLFDADKQSTTRVRNNGQASSWSDHVEETARNSNWKTLWEMWWQVRDLRLVCSPVHTCQSLWWVQLWILPRTLRHLWRGGNFRCLLLQGMYSARERSGWLSKDSQSRECKNRSVLWTEKIWFQEKIDLCYSD